MAESQHQFRKLLIASGNLGKIREISGLLTDLRLTLVGLSDIKHLDEVPETGLTFSENARLKASGYALQTGLYTIADDSGLEVESLGGRPGIHSARYGGIESDYETKISILLDELSKANDIDRWARFTCSMAISDTGGNILSESVGTCEGMISRIPSGNQGFGYDPIFVPEGYTLTFGQLGSDIKRDISHRAKAFSQIIPYLRTFIAI